MNRWLAMACLCALSLPLVGQEAAAPPPAPCSSPEHRQFDFWVGDWEVYDTNDQLQGTNLIEKIHGGCVIRESWSSSQVSGSSHNVYDQRRGVWHQTWVDSAGTLLQIEGGMRDGSMVLEGTTPGRDGGTLQHRITWTPLEDGRVRQHWQTSVDGQAWSDAFLGFYSPKAGS